MKNDFLLLDDEDIEYIWHIVQNQQVIFHPFIAPEGQFDYKTFFETKRKKPFVLFIDRNILSGLINFCEQGKLQDKGESQLIGIIMTWAIMNDITISAGPAVQEGATQVKNQEQGLIELNRFFTIIDAYPSQMWLSIARGETTEIPPIKFSNEPANSINAQYANGCDHFFMTLASMLHIVQLYRKSTVEPVDKVLDFIQWTFDNLLVSQYMLVYAILLFSNQENIKAPKGVNSKDISRIVEGCENQAWDLTYLSNWSTLYTDSEKYKEEFLFSTNDKLLKRIFVNAHGRYDVNGLLYTVFSQKNYDKICDLIECRQRNRVKPDFGSDPYKYFQKLISKEKQMIRRKIK